MAVKDYNTDPDLNTSISGINIAEGCPPSGINDAIRQLMADVKEESEAIINQASIRAEAQAAKDAEQDAALATTNSNLATTNSNLAVLDASVVHKTGDETIEGYKFFKRNPYIQNTAPAFNLKNTDMALGETPSANLNALMRVVDKNEAWITEHKSEVMTDGTIRSRINVRKNSTSFAAASLGVEYPASGSPYAIAPSTPAGYTGNQIVTADFLQKDQTMAGVKTFTGSVNLQSNNPWLYITQSDIELGGQTPPSSTQMTGVEFRDKNNKSHAVVFSGYSKGGISSIAIGAKDPLLSGAQALLQVAYPASGTPYASAPTPAADSNTTHIATTEWVRGKGVLVESWHSGTEWYRKYSDGWIEQGGTIALTYVDSGNYSKTVSLHTAMTTTNYLFLTGLVAQSHYDDEYASKVSAKTTTAVTLFVTDVEAQNIDWYVCGY